MYINVPERKISALPGPGQYKIPSKFDKYEGLDIIAKKMIKKLSRQGQSQSHRPNLKNTHEDVIR
jgi:hypothetical protein